MTNRGLAGRVLHDIAARNAFAGRRRLEAAGIASSRMESYPLRPSGFASKSSIRHGLTEWS